MFLYSPAAPSGKKLMKLSGKWVKVTAAGSLAVVFVPEVVGPLTEHHGRYGKDQQLSVITQLFIRSPGDHIETSTSTEPVGNLTRMISANVTSAPGVSTASGNGAVLRLTV